MPSEVTQARTPQQRPVARVVRTAMSPLRKMMHRHLKLTTNEAVAELTGKFGASVHAYDMVEHEILGMADMLSTGIIAQFPGRFS